MRSFRFLLLLPLLALLLTTLAPTARAGDDPRPGGKGTAGFQVFGYHAWWMRDTWRTYDFGSLDKLMYFELRATGDGSFIETNGWPGEGTSLRSEARRAGTMVVPTVAVLDETSFTTLFGSPANMRRLLDNTMKAVLEAQADGVHLNFEMFAPVSRNVRGNITRFVQDLRAALDRQRPGAEITVFTPGFDYPDVYDEGALARVADFLVVQGYDMHWSTGPSSGPLSPLRGWDGVNWESILKRYLDLGVPREKIVMTIPFYGYEWPTVSDQPGAPTRGMAKTITYAPVSANYLPLIQVNALDRVGRHGVRRDPVSQSPYYVYKGTDGWYQGWYEDTKSLQSKYEFIRREKLAGIAIFLLGYDGGQLMRSLGGS